MKIRIMSFSLLLIAMLLLSACGIAGTPAPGGKLRVLATNSIVGDVVGQVGGDNITLSLLMPLGTDPHDYQPRPQDAITITGAQLIFANGAGLEASLQSLFNSTGATSKLVEISDGVTLLQLPGSNQSTGDPHTWMDPNNVLIWTQNILTALSAADPVHAAAYQANAKAYDASLHDLDTWIRSEVAQIPPQNRLLVTDHAVLGYFAVQYGFTQVGSITGSFSSEAAPSAKEVAALEEKIRQTGVRAVFVSEAANQGLADQIASDTGIRTVWIYHATLTASSGPVPTYLDFMRYNVNAIVGALK
jgi:ABC-type Zn uptake system ZnuABC Zn-binding protein ZnuA